MTLTLLLRPVSQWLYIINYARGPEKDFASLPDGTFVVGTRVQYKCKSRFYKLYGSEYQTCQASRIWSGYQPACIPGELNTVPTEIILTLQQQLNVLFHFSNFKQKRRVRISITCWLRGDERLFLPLAG